MNKAKFFIGSALFALISFSGFWFRQMPPTPDAGGVPLRDDVFKEKAKSPYDQPAEAAAFFQAKRMPPGENLPTYHQRLFAAEQESQNLPLFSSRFDAFIERDQVTRFGGAASWGALGPGNIGGRTRAMVIHPTSPDTMVAGGVSGGTWRTTDGGANWTATGDMLANLAVTSMAMDPNDSDTILAGTGEGFFNIDAVRGAGIFKSTDGGLTWSYLANTSGSDFYYVNDLVYSTTVANTVYAATRNGVFRSTDGGTNWTQVLSTGVTGGCLDLAIRSDQATDVLFASVGTFTTATIYRNSDAANTTTFSSVYSETNMGRTTIAIAPSDQDVIYLLASTFNGAGISGFSNGLLAVIRSTDGGTNWSDRHRTTSPLDGADLLLSNPLAFYCSATTLSQGWYDNIIAVDPLDSDIVWAGGIDTFRSDDGGATWGMASHWAVNDSASMYVHADQHGFFFHPDYNGTTNQTMFVTNDGGIFRTQNARAAVATIGSSAACSASGTFSVTFTSLNNSYGVTQFYHGLPYPGTDTYFGGTQDNGTLRGDDASGLNSWTEVFGGDGGYVAVNPGNTDILYVETTGISIRKSTNGGSSFTSSVSGISDSGLFINPFLMDPNNSDRLWTTGLAIWRTDDAAGSWTQASTIPSSRGEGSAIAVAPGNSDLVLVGTDLGYIRRTTSATTATSSTVWTETRPQTGYVSSVAFDPQDANIAYCTYATFGVTHVYRSTDGGASWTSIENNLPDIPVHSIAVHPTDSTRLYLGTDLGVYVSTDTGANWAQENTGYANVVTEWLAFQETDCELNLYAFTHGRGAWRLPLDGLSLSASSVVVDAAGTSGSITVTAPSGCSWTATPSESWVTITSGSSGTGNGTVQYTVSANTDTTSRSATITIGSETFSISQNAAACTYALSVGSTTVDAAGGTGSFTVTPNGSNCAWTASASDSWITITAGSSGTGTGSVAYSIAANTDTVSRSGSITVQGETYAVTQNAAACTYALSAASNSFDDAGGTGSFNVTTNGSNCAWTASASESWVTITAGASGTGNGSVSYSVAAHTGTGTRTATITVQDQTYSISQTGVTCTYTLSASSNSFDATGGTGSFNVTTNVQTCTWTVVASESWVTITAGSSGTGDGTVGYSVGANSGTETRTATITVADQTYSISQTGLSCAYTLSASSNAFGDTGGTGSFNVTTNVQTCSWTAVSSESWLTVTSGAAGTGDGTVAYSVAANTTTETRTATITVADQTYSVSQTGVTCAYTLSASSNTFSDTGGTGSFNVTTNVQTCSWTAVASESWLTVTAGSSGTGDGAVGYSVAANTGTETRTATITVADQTYTVSQSGVACAYTLSSGSNSFDDTGGTGSFTVTTNVQTCSWTASSNESWLTITAGANGTGNGTLSYSVAANTATSTRTATITLADQTYTVSQSGVNCSYSLSASANSFGDSGGTGSFNVTTNVQTCSWTAVASQSWVTVTAGTSGTGDGTVSYSVAANTTIVSRSATIAVGNQTYTISQAGVTCAYSLSASSNSFDDTGGTGSFNITTNVQTCMWTATTQFEWITLTSGTSGTGNGSLSYSVAANPTTDSRTGTIQVEDQTYTIQQSGVVCGFTLSASSASFSTAGGTDSFNVTANVQTCTWTATTQDSWITITGGSSGTGDGTVSFTVAANSETDARNGTITAGGQTFSISQSGVACTYTLSSSSASYDDTGGSGSFNVTTNVQTCSWTATTQDDWITITSGASGTGNDSVGYSVAVNDATTTRTGAIQVGDQTYSVSQSGVACAFTLSPTSSAFDGTGGDGTFAVTANVQTCSWTATTQDSWVTISAGASGTGNGTVSYSVAANPTTDARTATISVAGQTFTINQSGAVCSFTLSAETASFDAAGGSGSFNLTANVQTCPWTATTQETWITITAGASGTGDGTVSYTVAAHSGISARTGTITAAGRTFSVSQTGLDCTYTLSSSSLSVDDQGVSASVDVTASVQTCTWTASTQDPWITITSGASGTGNGTVNFSVAANTAGTRTGTIQIADQTFTVSQSGVVCSFSLNPGSASFTDQGGGGSFNVDANVQTCAWTATTQDPWITITAGGSGTGNGTVSFTVAANPAGARDGAIVAGGQTFAVSQSAFACSFSLSPTSASFGAGGESGGFEVIANSQQCSWTATTKDPWITITSGASGSGSGSVLFSVTTNGGTSARTGQIVAAGQVFTVQQAGASCSYNLTISSASFSESGGSGTFEILPNGETCTWSATTAAEWITITSGASGTGNGVIGFSVAVNDTLETRTGTILVADQMVSILQTQGTCAISLASTSADFTTDGGTGSIGVTTNLEICTWTTSSLAEWITITQGQSGVGNGTVGFSVAENTSTQARIGNIQIGNRFFTVNQAGVVPCAYSLEPSSATVAADGVTGTFEVQTNKPDCTWNAVSQDAWITVSAGQSGTGSGGVTYVVAVNDSTVARSGTIEVEDQTFTVQQAGRTACDLTLNASSQSFFEGGGTGGFEIQTNLSTCDWTVATQDDWITLTAGQSGSGSGSVTFAVAELGSGDPRTGTVTVTNRDETMTFTVSQRRCTLSDAFFAALPNWNESVTVLDLVPLSGCAEARAAKAGTRMTPGTDRSQATQSEDR